MMCTAAASYVVRHSVTASPPSSSSSSSSSSSKPLLFRPPSLSLHSVSKFQFVEYAVKLPSRTRKLEAVPESKSSSKMCETEDQVKSDTYSSTMTQAMGADLTYRHELGINYNFIRPDLIVGSCLQTPDDVDKLRHIGVRTIFCLQQDPDLEYFGVDIKAIQEYSKKYDDIEHIRAEIRDFDGFDLRVRLPAVLSILYKAVNRNGGVTYIHCTAGMGRAPAVALAYMYWVQGYELNDAHKMLLSKRACCPKVDAIKSATADILTGLKKQSVSFKLTDQRYSLVEIAGLDAGWSQRIPLEFNEGEGAWILNRELAEGSYEYKYVVDGEWICNTKELVTTGNNDGNVNNYVVVLADDPNSDNAKLRERLTGDNPYITPEERLKIRQFLEK